ncbi:MAG TPA: substrate-binding domain-containing protein [Paenibacillus sp.]|uniref:substrate-binding domain-containing protein n=1 Tax=Paenibacillus sp. TaxID=58172 RepID=UPI002BF1B100|nr:substrate-binding domain-containing protein [Paenibacillus sp.]HUC91307.1 substrate-binding domain-containing protein [Paenibacillus sp.]
MKKKSLSIIVTTVLAFALVITGCGKSNNDSAASNTAPSTSDSANSSANESAAPAGSYEYKTKAEGDIVIGFSQAVMNHPFRIANVESAKKTAAELGIELIVTDGQGDVNKEISNIESLIARKVDAIIVSSLSGKAIYPAYKQVAEAKIPLIIAASGVPDDESIPYVSYVATDEVSMGQQAAQYIAKMLGNKGNIVVIDGVPESTNSELRRQGFMPEIAKFADIEVVAQQSGDWLRLPAMQVMTNILQANDKIDVVFAQNDEMGFGALEAIKKAGREKEIKVVGMDAQKEALELVKNSDNYVMTVKNEWSLDTAVKLAVDAVRGKPIEKRVVLDSPVIDKSNIDEYYDPNSIF